VRRRVTKVKKIISLLSIVVLMSILTACATTPHTYEGAGAGAVLGGVAGALLDRHNPWRGGIIGAAIGAVAGGTFVELSARASRESALSGRPVEYRTEDGRGVYRADPMGYDGSTRCSKIHERAWEDGRLVKDQIKEVCEGTRYERRY
jgi:outer membrane lipoprotein SlyB